MKTKESELRKVWKTPKISKDEKTPKLANSLRRSEKTSKENLTVRVWEGRRALPLDVCLWWYDEFHFWSSCVQVRLSTCSDMEDARALLIDVERQRLGGSHLWDEWLTMSSRSKSSIEVRFGAELVCKPCSDGCFHRSLDVEMFAHPFVGPSCHVHAQVFAQRNRGNAWVDWKASVYIRRTNLSWSDCLNVCKMALPHWCYNVGCYVLTAFFFPTQFSLVVTR